MAGAPPADDRHSHNPVVRYFGSSGRASSPEPRTTTPAGSPPTPWPGRRSATLLLVMLVGNDRRIMGAHVNSVPLNVLGWAATGLMTLAALALLGASVL